MAAPTDRTESLTLALDSSTYEASVALLRGARVLGERVVAMRGAREERLMPAVAALLSECGVTVGDVDRVVCGAGPGSFTSLRIGAAIAKGIAAALGVPLLAVPSLALLAAGAAAAPGRYVAALDALRGELFAATFDVDDRGRPHSLGTTELVARGSELVSGNGAGTLVTGAPRASAVARLLGDAGDDALVREVALKSWEPEYGRRAEAQVRWEAAHGRPLRAS